ncbi:MAG: diguanylate cyclase [Dehalococcoidia bacterium]
MKFVSSRHDDARPLPALPRATPEEETQIREQSARLIARGSDDYAASREFVIELLRLHYTRSRPETVSEIISMVERALPGARTLPFFFDRWTLMLEGGIAGQVERDSVRLLLRDLKLDPDKMELTVAEGSAAQRILEDGEVVAVEPTSLLTGLTIVRPENVGIRGAIAVPLEVDGEAFGILCVFLPAVPSAAERAKLELIAAHGAIAIRNERDFDEAQRLNGIDPITWVGNRRSVVDRLGAEMERSRRYSHDAGAMVLAVAGFLAYSQRVGAGSANQLLRRVAMSLSSGFRAPDFTGRLDESQFLVVLPETDAAGCRVVRDRTLQRLAALKVSGMGEVSFRAALAAAPEDGWSTSELLEKLSSRLATSASSDGPDALSA